MLKIFIGVVFLLFYIHKFLNPLNLIKSNEELMRIGNNSEKMKEYTENNPQEAFKAILVVVVMLVLQIVEFFYHISLLKIEQLKNVSLLMIVWFVVIIVKAMIKNKKLKKDPDSGEKAIDKVLSKKSIIRIRFQYAIDILYFSYVLFILISIA